MKSLRFIRKTFVYRDIPSSGVMCLLSIIRYHKGAVDSARLLPACQSTDGRTFLSDLANVAETVGLRTQTGASTLSNLKKFPHPVILHIRNDWGAYDFAVCYGFHGRFFLVGVPNWGFVCYCIWNLRVLLKGNRSCKMKKNEKIDLVYKLCRYVVDTLFWGCMVMALFVVMQIFLFSSFKIPSNSMEPGLIAGDYVLVNKLIPGARLFNVFASLRGEQVQIVRLPGLREIRRNDVVVFNYPYPNNLDRIEMHMMKYYIKRCLGLPGDSLSIVNGYYRVNGIFEPVGNIEGQELFSVQSNKMLKDAGLYWSFPKDSLISWNVKNFGPLYLPRKGDVIDMNRENISIYRKLIEWETGQKLDPRIVSYTFQKNYYFVAGDRIEDSQDSRYWGLLPEEFIVGKATFIWRSMNPQTRGVRWDRICSRIE